MITDYLLELLGELRLPTRRRRRILAEVEDHLACAAAELHAGGLDVEEAEREAARRFGPAPELACAFVEQEAAVGGKRLARASGLLAVLLAALVLGPPGRVLPYGAFPSGLVAFVLAQVALVAGGLTLVRAWRAAPAGGPRGPRLALVLRGAVVVTCCAAGAVAYGTADAVARASSASSGWTPVAWLSLASLALGVAATAATLSRCWRLATAARAAGAAISQQSAFATSGAHPDALADLQGVGALALERLQRRMPTLRGVLGRLAARVQALPAELTCRAPRLAGWLDLRRHPWRFAVSVATVAGLALAGGHALAEGVSARHLLGALLVAALIATIETVAALLGFAVLGRFLRIRPPRASG